jgi:hypothetical protein
VHSLSSHALGLDCRLIPANLPRLKYGGWQGQGTGCTPDDGHQNGGDYKARKE